MKPAETSARHLCAECAAPLEASVEVAASELRLVEAPSGGGGYLEVRGRQVRLTDTQFAMLAMMAARMAAETAIADVVRGFVPSVQLIASLPWDSQQPTDTHLKQLVRRTRRALEEAGLGDLIESRRLFGYRLRVTPHA